MSARCPRNLAIAWMVSLVAISASARSDEPSRPGWKLTWQDEFNGDAIDRTKWDFDLGNGFFQYEANQWISGWGNEELQYYTREPENAFVSGGHLHIRAIRESLHGCGYTSARMKTRKRDGSPLFAQRYGRFEFRAKLPTGQGVWPAFWLLPQDEVYGPWPSSGEIDVLEARGQEPNKVLGTLHYGSRWPANTHSSRELVLPRNGTIAEFHTYAIEWDPGEIVWFVDDKEFGRQSFWWSSRAVSAGRGLAPKSESEVLAWPAPFDQPFYLIMNLAVGGRFVGKPDSTTRFPAEMQIDYVRVYERTGGPKPIRPRGSGRLPFER